MIDVMKKITLELPSIIMIILVVSCSSIPSVVHDPNNISGISSKCAEMIPSLDIIPDGTIVLQDEITRNIALFDLQSDKETMFEEAVFVMAVSPDNKQLAYTDETTKQLIILSSTGEKESIISVPQDWIGVVSWIASDTLLMEKFIGKPFGLASSVIYHLENGRSEEYLSSYPGIRTAIPPLQWGNYSYTRTVYDPSFSRVVFAAGDEHGLPLLRLWDLKANREVVEFHQGYDNHIGGAPQWMRDGSAFIAGIYPQQQIEDTLYKNVHEDLPYKGGFELFQVSRDGKIMRLTYLTIDYDAGEEGFSLSPDEKHVAFWLNLNYKPGDLYAERKLAILNTKTGEITDLCIAGGATPTPPIWSPDGKHLVVSRYYVTGDALTDALLIDLENNQGVKIANNVIAKGWLVK
jgi:WD40 repeat protein